MNSRRGCHALHPFVALIYFIGAAVLTMTSHHPIFLLAEFMLIIVLNGMQDCFRSLKKWGWGYFVLSLFILILTPLMNHRGTHILFYFHGNPVLFEAVIEGLILTLSLLCLLILFISYNQVMTPTKFLYLFARILPQWALLTMLTIRFVPLLQRRLSEIEVVQRSKGVSFKTGNLFQRARNGMKLVHILLEWSLEEAIQTADSMKARGYGVGKRNYYSSYRWTLMDGLALLFILVMGSLLIFGWWLGDTVLTLNPVLEPIWLSGREWFYFAVLVAYFGFPVFLEGREMWLWHFWKRKI